MHWTTAAQLPQSQDGLYHGQMGRLATFIVALAVALGGIATPAAEGKSLQSAMTAMNDCECPPSNSPCPDPDKDKCGGMAGCVMRCATAPSLMPAPAGAKAKAAYVVVWSVSQNRVPPSRALLPPLPPPRSPFSI